MQKEDIVVEYTSDIFVKFLNALSEFDKDVRITFSDTDKRENEIFSEEKKEWVSTELRLSRLTSERVKVNNDLLDEQKQKIKKIFSDDLSKKKGIYTRLRKCMGIYQLIDCSESSISNKEWYNAIKNSQTYPVEISVDDLITDKVDFAGLSYAINVAIRNNKKKDVAKLSSQFYCLCEKSKELLIQEISMLRTAINENQCEIQSGYENVQNNSLNSVLNEWDSTVQKMNEMACVIFESRNAIKAKSEKAQKAVAVDHEKRLDMLVKHFCDEFPPEEFVKEYVRLYSLEPSFEHYECVKYMPQNLYISTLEYDVSSWELTEYTKELLHKYYYFMYRENRLFIPNCVQFNADFNYLFRFREVVREKVVENARNLGMRVFMMLPPGKVKCTFVDPVKLGDSFALFRNLVDADDQVSEVIDGQIWSKPEDIEEKLRITTDHISNVTQRCLQGKYENIFEYNRVAEQNAEAYQILHLMDFPAGMTEQSLKMLEQIIASGPKCGVFTVIYKNESQFSKVSERSYPLIKNVENGFKILDYSDDGNKILYANETIKGQNLIWNDFSMPIIEHIEGILDMLKKGIKNAEKIVIGFDKILPDKSDWFKGDCSEDLSIPIGIHGANNIQNLRFGVGGSHHALVAGQTGSGKSSLLHTIIMSSLIKYPANQLQIFLVDFKRGVEFKIYANHSLENFKVIAIESEREFGCSVLEYLDWEQSRRADMFKRLNVDNVRDYRSKSGETLPRILLIIDEFHILFSKDTNDSMNKYSTVYLEQIIRQGRAFGIHVILASQTMSNIGGISNGVWGQVGVRIALKCPKSDAKFVLGSDNDGVDLLSAENPGQAVYNSDCGNIIANTIFRVAYIEQEEQDMYLEYISANSPRFGYSETRIMLSNVEDNIYNPFQKFCNGEKVDFSENSIMVGESLKLVGNMTMKFKNKNSSNMLVIGNDEYKARSFFCFSALSMVLHILSTNDYKKPEKKKIYLFDYAPLENFYEKDILNELSKMLRDYIYYISFDEANDELAKVYASFSRREKGIEEKEDCYLLFYGLQRARDLRSNNIYQNKANMDDFDEFGSSVTQQLTVKPHEMFLNLLQRGASVGINSLVWEDNFKVFMAHYANMLSNFDMRVAFTMPDEDSINFIEEPNGSKIRENGAIYSFNGNQKFRPYKKPDLEWLKKICNRINEYR